MTLYFNLISKSKKIIIATIIVSLVSALVSCVSAPTSRSNNNNSARSNGGSGSVSGSGDDSSGGNGGGNGSSDSGGNSGGDYDDDVSSDNVDQAQVASDSVSASASGNKQSAVYDNDTVVVVSTAADVYESADRTSKRITQVLFNQAVQVMAQNDLWAKVKVDDSNAGWIRAREIDGDWTCIDARRYSGRIIVTNREKQVYSQPRNGIVIRDVGMGTELFFYSRSDNVYEIALPGNLTGWISESGTFQLEVDEPIKKTSADVFVQSCEKFKGTGYLLGGVSSLGIDSAGIIHIAMKINGVSVPRDYNNQFRMGEEVEIEDFDNIDQTELLAGDILFFGTNRDAEDSGDQRISDAGVYIGEGEFLHASQHTGRVQLNSISDDYYKQRLKGVRRYF